MKLRRTLLSIGTGLGLFAWTLGAAADVTLRMTESEPAKSSATLELRNQPEEVAAFVPPIVAPAPLPRGTDLFQWYLDAAWQGDSAAGTVVEPDLTPDGVQLFDSSASVGVSYATTGPSFDVDAFEQGILDRMQGQAVGFSYAINQSGLLAVADSRGEIRNEVDGSAGMSQHQRLNIASISKNLTAVAVLQLLDANGLSVFEPIGPWLPAEWNLGYGFANPASITFYDLLTHRSGIKQSAVAYVAFDEEFAAIAEQGIVLWEGLEAVAEYGILPVYLGEAEYSNVNYALFRAIIPALWQAAGGPAYGTLDALEAAALYQNYVGEHLLIPSGVHQAACHDLFLPIEPRYYNANEPDAPGQITSNWTLSCGSGGWVLSAVDLAAVMAHVRYDDNILSPEMRAIMDEWQLGWQPFSSLNGHGNFLAHGGALWFEGDPGERAEMVGCIMKFPIQVEANLLANSSIVGDPNPCNILRDAYDEAWLP